MSPDIQCLPSSKNTQLLFHFNSSIQIDRNSLRAAMMCLYKPLSSKRGLLTVSKSEELLKTLKGLTVCMMIETF